MLHSFVPHQHHDELGQAEHISEHSSATSTLDFLSLIFHENLGENHLENFENTECHFDFVAIAVLPSADYSLAEVVLAETESKYQDYPNAIPISVYPKTSSERGPPTA